MGAFRGPDFQQLELPGVSEPKGPTQMRMFDTLAVPDGVREKGTAVYARNPSLDAAEWNDQDIFPGYDKSESETMFDPDGGTIQGEFFEFEHPVGSREREFQAGGSMHKRLQGQEGVLGHDAFPERVRPELQFSDLSEEGGYGMFNEKDYLTDEGSLAGRVQYHEDEWGPNVDYAEINPLYKGRKFSRDAILDFAGDLGPGEGIVHAGGFTDAGAGAFHAKGIPTEGDISRGLDDYRARQTDLAYDYIDDEAVEQYARNSAPDLPWEEPDTADDAAWEEMDFAIDDAREQVARSLAEGWSGDNPAFDEAVESEYRSELEGLQQFTLNKIRSRLNNFTEGKGGAIPKKTAVQEKLNL